MSDLIDRDALKEVIDNTDWYSGEYGLHLGAKDEESAYYRAQDIRDAINSAPTVDAEPVRRGHWIMEAIMPTHATDTVKVIGRCSECGCYDAICHADAFGYYKGNPIIWAGFITNYKGNERLAEEFALTNAGNREKNRYCPHCGRRVYHDKYEQEKEKGE